MKRDIWVISDTHFGHAKMMVFTEADGKPVRDGFTDVNHMNDTMVERWNSKVKEGDLVYHLGDVAIGKGVLHAIMPRLNGSKRLIMGNHDLEKPEVYGQYFQKVMSWRQWKFGNLKMVMCHYPLHESAFMNRHGGDFKGVCVHGHIRRKEAPTKHHINVCVEMINYTPVHLDDLVAQAKAIR